MTSGKKLIIAWSLFILSMGIIVFLGKTIPHKSNNVISRHYRLVVNDETTLNAKIVDDEAKKNDEANSENIQDGQPEKEIKKDDKENRDMQKGK